MTTNRDAVNQIRSELDGDVNPMIRHYIYIPKKSHGKVVAKQLRDRGFDVEDRLGADDINWLVRVKHRIDPNEEALKKLKSFFESMILQYGGEYDGWEVEVETD